MKQTEKSCISFLSLLFWFSTTSVHSVQSVDCGTFHMACSFCFRLCCIHPAKTWIILLYWSDDSFLPLNMFPNSHCV